MKAILIALAFCMLAAPAAQAQPALTAPDVPTITVRDLQAMIKEKTYFILLDVREPKEFAQSHIAGAMLMPLGSVPAQYRQLPAGAPLVVYCRTGHRSAKAVSFLLDHGYSKAVSLAGGYTAWTAAQ
ncbi:MAG: rhodanese-like domain-containing protein [Alphaproteobacteria bacterium]|nr:rhodanese-like domain-containing protein [Alphaproteobacteria bacterium]MDE2112130.1 rhodanese-like domain-containing protein [Alphaproteobacteria bacterium]MDE2493928.1 rhodanese-like domain-containing protein [Alphaproteobacteria bacterium]